jgi:membrane peptidoglycan carboxypeptidase
MSMTTVNGTGTAAAYGLGNRPIIAKTGTSSGSTSGFFIGAIPQYSLVVGIFTHSQDPKLNESLVPLTGGGFGGYWPAKIWNTFAQAEFANLPSESFQNAVFSGTAWNQVGKIAAPKPTVNCMVNGKKKKINGKTCPTPTPAPTPTCSYPGEQNQDGCTTGSAGATPTPTPTCSYPGEQNCSSSGTGTGGNGTTPTGVSTNAVTASSTKAGLAAGGALVALPGSFLWTVMSRRRRKRRAGTPQ